MGFWATNRILAEYGYESMKKFKLTVSEKYEISSTFKNGLENITHDEKSMRKKKMQATRQLFVKSGKISMKISQF